MLSIIPAISHQPRISATFPFASFSKIRGILQSHQIEKTSNKMSFPTVYQLFSVSVTTTLKLSHCFQTLIEFVYYILYLLWYNFVVASDPLNWGHKLSQASNANSSQKLNTVFVNIYREHELYIVYC